MEHHHGFDYMPDQPTATCGCGLTRPNPYYGVHLHITEKPTWMVRQYRKLRYELHRAYNRLMFRLTNPS